MPSFTAQYATAAAGRLLPAVFVCVQARSDAFGRRIRQEVKILSQIFGDFHVTAAQSGKPQKLLMNNVMDPYVNKRSFVLILGSSEGQRNPVLYDEKFPMKALSPSVH
jgi:hypothetical protein